MLLLIYYSSLGFIVSLLLWSRCCRLHFHCFCFVELITLVCCYFCSCYSFHVVMIAVIFFLFVYYFIVDFIMRFVLIGSAVFVVDVVPVTFVAVAVLCLSCNFVVAIFAFGVVLLTLLFLLLLLLISSRCCLKYIISVAFVAFVALLPFCDFVVVSFLMFLSSRCFHCCFLLLS